MEIAGTYVIVPFISGACNVLIDRLASKRTRELLMGHNSTLAKLSTLKTTMEMVNGMVNDIDPCTLGMQDPDPALKNLLIQIKNAVYDTEDLIEQILTKARRSPSTRHQIGQVLSTLNPFHERLVIRIQEMNETFRSFAKLLSQYATTKLSIPSPTPYILDSTETSSFVDESMVVGRDSEREQIFKVLEDGVPRVYEHRRLLKGKDIPLVSVPVDKDIRVIAIVGMPGIGKTTLAQVVFNDPRADHIFNLKAWVYVPKLFDATQIINKILSLLPQVSHHKLTLSENSNNLELSQQILRDEVAAHRIMIVLDDLWDNANLNVTWQNLLNSLKPAAPGSTIIVTTRNEVIARELRPILTLTLHELPDDDAWFLFKALAFGSSIERLETVARKIAAKGGGLPLAIAALGRLLKNITSDANHAIEWESIANSKLWDLPDSVKKEILPALLISYNYLPQPVKRCFAYCSIFPKNYQFDKQKLVFLWMAEGFLEKPRSQFRQMEDIGNAYFNALKSQFFFQVSNSEQHYFVMHDLIHNLAVYVMGEFGSMLEPNTSINAEGMLRHLSYKQSKYDTAENFRLIAGADQLRTFLPVGSEASPTIQSCFYINISVLQSLKAFGCLRVLSLCGYRISNIPPLIGSLQLLCYLDFSFTCIEYLPESICDLSNLQTLLLRHCRRLRKLPVQTRKLVNLRHLDICETMSLQEMPNSIGSLVHLQTLTKFIIGKDNRNIIRELGEFTQLRGSLRISGLDNIVNEEDVYAADLRGKAHLDELVFTMQFYGGPVLDTQHEKNLNASRPHTNLRRLTIDQYGGYRFPNWVGDEAFFNLEVLRLVDCPNCEKLPSLGHLPSLKHLLVHFFKKLETVGLKFYGQFNDSSPPFKSLVTLEFKNLNRWKKWTEYPDELDPFPCLEKLTLCNCPELEGRIPSRLPSLVDLDISYCYKFVCYLPESINLRKLSLFNVGRLDLRDLAGFTCLTDMSVGNPRISVADVDTSIANTKNVLPQMTSLENLSLRLYGYPGRRDERWNLPSSIRSITVSGECIGEFDAFIEGCEQLQFLCVENLDSCIEFPPGHSQVLNYLGLDLCYKLEESLILAAGDDLGLQSLYDLSISGSSNVELLRFPARNLTTLSLSECWNLRSLPNGMAAHFPCLQFLCISRCPLSGPFPEGDLPSNLQTLRLEYCSTLHFLSETLSLCTSLKRLSIIHCLNLESFPTMGLPPNLQELQLKKCPQIEAFSPDGLPPHLRLLSVNGCEGLSWNYTAWQLNKLTCFQELQIMYDEHVEFFPANGSMPKTLVILHIEGFSNLRSINCRELQAIPSLRELVTSNCRNLLSAEGDLPRSLCRLSILGSPLATKCSKPDWSRRHPHVKRTSHITFLELIQ